MPDAARAERLSIPLADGVVHLEPLAEIHREPLRTACAEDRDIWTIYPVSMLGDRFDPVFDAIIADPRRHPFATFAGGRLVGCTGYLNVDAANATLEIGGTYLVPPARGGRVNARVKRLQIDHAIACGFTRLEFRIDTRNARSMAAVEKLGAVREGTLRQNRVTWTGFVRDTAVYAILANEWRLA